MLGGSFNFDAAVRDIVRFKLDLRATARTANDKDNMIGEILDMRPDVPAYKEDGTINEISYYVKNPLLSPAAFADPSETAFAAFLSESRLFIVGISHQFNLH